MEVQSVGVQEDVEETCVRERKEHVAVEEIDKKKRLQK